MTDFYASIHEQIQEHGSFKLDLRISQKPKNKFHLYDMLEVAIIEQCDEEWILAQQDQPYCSCEGLNEAAECIIAAAEICYWARGNDDLVYELELEADSWIIEKAESEHKKHMNTYYKYLEEQRKAQ